MLTLSSAFEAGNSLSETGHFLLEICAAAVPETGNFILQICDRVLSAGVFVLEMLVSLV